MTTIKNSLFETCLYTEHCVTIQQHIRKIWTQLGAIGPFKILLEFLDMEVNCCEFSSVSQPQKIASGTNSVSESFLLCSLVA